MSAAPSSSTTVRFRTAREWLDAIGDVPPERIIFDPPPGTATEADLLARDRIHPPCELVNGTLVEKTMGFYEGLLAVRIAKLLGIFVDTRGLGLVNGAGGMTRLLDLQIRLPDVAFYPWSLFPNRELPRQAAPRLVPALAVEVLSPGNTKREMQLKLEEYFEAGTKLVWYVDPATNTIAVYTSTQNPTVLTTSDRLTGGDVLPGFDVGVREVFEVA
jgi:Uma2 family endonuclease